MSYVASRKTPWPLSAAFIKSCCAQAGTLVITGIGKGRQNQTLNWGTVIARQTGKR